MATHGWKFDFVWSRLFFPTEDLPETDEEEEEDDWNEFESSESPVPETSDLNLESLKIEDWDINAAF